MMNYFYAGGYYVKQPNCLYRCSLDVTKENEVALKILEGYDITNAVYMCFSTDKKVLYAVIETAEYKGQYGGGLAAFAVGSDGKLSIINEVGTGGNSPCHLSVSDDNTKVYVAHYMEGTTAIFNIESGGAIGELIKVIDHSDFSTPSRTFPGRQEGCHAHFVEQKNDSLWMCDLGTDSVFVFNLDGGEPRRIEMQKGYGPRHLTFHPTLPFAYLINEFSCTVVTINTETLELMGEVDVLKTADPNCTSAAIAISPNNDYLLVSNRGGFSNTISVLDLDDKGNVGKLKQLVESRGVCPRDFSFSPCGTKVLVANQDSDLITVLDWDGAGNLNIMDEKLTVQKPVCVIF